MVMKRNAMAKNLRQSILRSFGRYIAIAAIIGLGTALFIGLLMTKSDMVATGQKYMDEQNMFDLRLMTSYGWDKGQLEAISQMDGVVDAEGLIYLDAIANVADADESVYRFYAIPETVNRISLRGGRMPNGPDECLADGFHTSDDILGAKVTIAENNEEDTLEALTSKTYTVVGYVATPLYMDMNRGTTSVGNGSLASYFYIPESGFDVDYYPEIHVTIPGDFDVYTARYNDAMADMADKLEPWLEPLAQQRLEQVKREAEQEYQDGLEEYLDGEQEYLRGKKEAEEELADAFRELTDGEQQIKDNEQLLIDGAAQIEDAKKLLKESEKTLKEGEKELADAKAAAYKEISKSTTSMMEEIGVLTEEITYLQNEMTALETELLRVNMAITPLETELALAESAVAQTESMIGIQDSGIEITKQMLALAQQNGSDEQTIAELQQRLEEQEASRNEYANKLEQQKADRDQIKGELAPLYDERRVLESQKSNLESQSGQLEASISSIMEKLVTITAAQSVMDSEFAAAQAQLESGAAQIEAGYLELEMREQELEDGRAELEKAKLELEDGWKEYREGKAEAEQELADAEVELADAKLQLDDARELIDSMTENSVIVLDRTSNIGYNSLDSASDIVSGVSRVFPVFFLLVASLVCITTMTRMIDEERTQIGTLKALGYSNGAIISKYLIYAGSGAVVGCGLGVTVGSAIFPSILWQAYKIMLYITDGIVLKFNWVLCGIVVLSYTVVMLLVTYYCCRRALEEEPAELIRPKAPEAGKKVIFEYFRWWTKVSFLNKVTIRNIFRYRQRLAMMLVGIGGCTALLLTGFGLRDSIVNVVDYQFEEVTVYDMTVYFAEGRTEEQKEEFLSDLADSDAQIMFYHQSSIDLTYDDQTKEIYLISADEGVRDFIDFHTNDKQLPLPGNGEVLLSVGVAEAMDIDIGDQVMLRNADMQMLDLTVSGIYDNHVYNYAIVSPQSILSQWGALPEEQMAFVKAAQGQDAHELSARISGLEDVMNISVSEDLADMVGGMMDALDLVVWVIVFCAGLLGAIVLHNLTNININERIREIATIKVLGFNAGETAAYIFKENLSLSAVGSILGLGLGYLLLLFVMSQIKIDMVYFKALLVPVSYLISVVLTMLTACVVDFIFYFKLDKINMAEALKSVE